TTAYVWSLQNEALREKTLKTLEHGYFNKIRYCVFPKHYIYNYHEPVSYPYEGTPCTLDPETKEIATENQWDFTRFNPAHFRGIEKSIEALGALGVEADLILMHPYDRWGFSNMTAEQDDLYLRYILARFSAFRNVWWSLANEYDLLPSKTTADWERFASIILDRDPYKHLRSIHNCRPLYDHARPWITHCSIQRTDLYKTTEYTDMYRIRYGKPVIMDEIAYEGDIDMGWGNITGPELVRRYWECSLRGGYATHGETCDRPDGILWWSHGGDLHGDSPARLRFLHKILSETPGPGLAPYKASVWDETAAVADTLDDRGYYLFYYGFMRPSSRTFRLSESARYRVEVIDTWEMTITDAGTHSGTFTIALPKKQYIAVRIKRV
ncbi:MAG: DUF5605 domain-containing protein, partial [Oscillospiraceae bacterium]|nr:DUF5605 domain-containing protein [Oscillospiraceae bacterium]